MTEGEKASLQRFLAGRQHRDGIVKALKPVYTAPSEQTAKDRFAEFTAEWGQRYPAIVRL